MEAGRKISLFSLFGAKALVFTTFESLFSKIWNVFLARIVVGGFSVLMIATIRPGAGHASGGGVFFSPPK